MGVYVAVLSIAMVGYLKMHTQTRAEGPPTVAVAIRMDTKARLLQLLLNLA